jgi:vanillate/3-O-methylgallate O-demethylase
VIVEGPDATAFLSHHGINSFANFDLNRAKHFRPGHPGGPCDRRSHHLPRARGQVHPRRPRPTSNWLMFCAAWGKWNVRLRYDPRSPSRPEGERVLREHYRFQIQGPDAPKVFEKMNGGPVPEIKFFHVDWINIGSKKVQALRHGMSGAPGLEIWGPYKDKDYIHSTILQAARDAGVNLVQCGSRAYSTNTLESGWIPSPCPGIYTGDGMLKDYRDWLGADSYEAAGAIGGSFVSDNIEDYYVNPFELGYDFYIGWKKDDFIGKAALQAMKGSARTARRSPSSGTATTCSRSSRRTSKRAAVQVDRLPAAELCLLQRRHGDAGRPDGRDEHVQRLFLQRTLHAVAGVVAQEVQEGDILTLKWGEPEPPARPRPSRTARPRSACAWQRRPMPPRRGRTTPTAGAPPLRQGPAARCGGLPFVER